MRLAYGKLGRSIPLSLDSASNVGGDAEVINLLHKLAQEHEVHIVGRNRADIEIPNVVNHWTENGVFGKAITYIRDVERYPDSEGYRKFLDVLETGAAKLPKFDAWVLWLGQHGSCTSFIPRIQEDTSSDERLKGLTRPLMSDINYGYPIVHLLNALDVTPIWLCPDPRNKLKLRDLKNPKQKPVLAQYNTDKNNKFYDPATGVKSASMRYIYSGIEMLALDTKESYITNIDREPPIQPFGILVNEGYTNLGDKGRLALVKKWLTQIPDWEIFGHWSDKSQAELGRVITPVPLDQVTATMRRWRSTITFPATNSGWATAKPWEAFAAGCICFKHPGYDTQGHIYSRQHMPEELLHFLSPNSPNGLQNRIEELKDDAKWRHYADMQWQYLDASVQRLDAGMATLKVHMYQAAGVTI